MEITIRDMCDMIKYMFYSKNHTNEAKKERLQVIATALVLKLKEKGMIE